MDSLHLIDRHKLRRALTYGASRSLRRLRIGHLIYDQSVSSFTREHSQIESLVVGDPARGRKIQNDKFPLSEDKTIALLSFWNARQKYPESGMCRARVSPQVIQNINQFDWLADLHALGKESHDHDSNANELDFKESRSVNTQQFCTDIVLGWIRSHQHWSALTWHVPTLARRINNWLYYYREFFGTRTNINFDSVFFSSISKQLTHLHTSVLFETQDFDRIISLISWINCSLCLSNEEKRLSEGVTLLSIELHNLFAKPHAELLASPRLILETHRHLQQVCKGFTRIKVSIPSELDNALQRFETLLQHYRVPNNTLAHFHGTWDMPSNLIKLPRRHNKNKTALKISPALIKVENGNFCVILDATHSPRPGTGLYMHRSPLAIEVYDGQQPIIINAAPPAENALQHHQEYRENVFHSMPLLENHTIGELRSNGSFGKQAYRVKQEVIHDNNDIDNPLDSIICSHNGYQKTLGATLGRTVDIWRDERNRLLIQGRDTLEFISEPRTDDPLRLVSLFHLQPELEITPLAGGGMLIFKKKRNEAWQFEALGPHASVHATQSLTSYRNGTDPVILHTLWMVREISQIQHLAQYSNEWILFRVNR
ncbi:MAG: heparinase II/III family protein [Alphaproteobacteria bacterium]|nr:heparinase II/III family protein [Alphaproteobacteria bacterium]